MSKYHYRVTFEEKKNLKLEDGWENYVVTSNKEGKMEDEEGQNVVLAILEKFKHLGTLTFIELERYE